MSLTHFAFSAPQAASLLAMQPATFTAKLVNNRTLFCHFSGKALNNTSPP